MSLPLESPVATTRAALKAGVIGHTELVQQCLDRIEAFDRRGPALNAIITVNPRALDEAAARDRLESTRTDLGPLFGIPVILKDNIDTAGMPTTGGALALAASVPLADAHVVQRLEQAGACILAKANLTELARTGTTVSALGGQTKNPYDLTRTPGGSSGGTAVAVAADYGIVGLGTDTAQSVRSPASATCLVGLRPTRGLISRRGVMPLSPTQDEVGPLTRTVEDAARMLDVLAGYDAGDPVTARGVDRRPESYLTALRPDGLGGTRIGLLRELRGGDSVHAEVNRVVDEAAEHMRRLGATVMPVSIPDLDALTQDLSLIRLEFRTAFDRYLESLGRRAPVRSFEALIARGEYHPSLRDLLEGDRASVDGPGSPDHQRQIARRDALRRAVEDLLARERLDAVMYPHQRRLVALIGDEQLERNGVLSNSTGFPAITFPGGFSMPTPSAPLGVPVGIELLGPDWSEPMLLRFAFAFEQGARIRRPPTMTGPVPR
jgi:Asp-tRNA(Asn)/Glu-tRNA(Gln) amidotransferase A subunit family amidase